MLRFLAGLVAKTMIARASLTDLDDGMFFMQRSIAESAGVYLLCPALGTILGAAGLCLELLLTDRAFEYAHIFLSTSSFRYNPLVRIGEGMSFSGLDGRLSQDAYRIVNHWLKTVKGGDPQAVADLYAERGVLLGTVARHIKQGRSVIKTYFDGFLRKHPVGFINSIIFQELGSDYVVADGNYTFELDGEDGRVRVPARFTFVIDLKTGLILTHHSSSTPDGQTTSI